MAAYRAQLPRHLWRVISLFAPGFLASHKWTEDFIEFATPLRPQCKYAELARVGGVMFDNYTRKVLYSSAVTVERHGYLLNMTNWATIRIPLCVAPPNFDPLKRCELLRTT